jgi:hypothetical protein
MQYKTHSACNKLKNFNPNQKKIICNRIIAELNLHYNQYCTKIVLNFTMPFYYIIIKFFLQ